MTTSNHPTVTATPAPIPPSRQHPRRRRFGPVTIVRPATVAMPTLTNRQRERRRAANAIAAKLTTAAREGRHPYIEAVDRTRIDEFTQAADIIATAAAIAADPTPGALRIGRNLRGRAVAVVVHSDDWSLVLHPGRGNRAPTSFTFIGGDNAGYGPPTPWCLDGDTTDRAIEWTDMLAAVEDIAA